MKIEQPRTAFGFSQRGRARAHRGGPAASPRGRQRPPPPPPTPVAPHPPPPRRLPQRRRLCETTNVQESSESSRMLGLRFQDARTPPAATPAARRTRARTARDPAVSADPSISRPSGASCPQTIASAWTGRHCHSALPIAAIHWIPNANQSEAALHGSAGLATRTRWASRGW